MTVHFALSPHSAPRPSPASGDAYDAAVFIQTKTPEYFAALSDALPIGSFKAGAEERLVEAIMDWARANVDEEIADHL